MSVPVLVHVRVPCFYASIERQRHRDLQGRPLIVGGDPRKRGQVQSASAEAVAAGVRDGMPMLEALERCPRARALKTDMKHYREVASDLRACLREQVDALEHDGLDAAYLDASRLPEDPESLGLRLREAVRERLRLGLQVGIAPVKFLAKLAAQESGESGLRRIHPGEEAAFLAPLPLSRLPGVGPRSVRELETLGARTVADLLSVRRERLEAALGNHGLRILTYARGLDSAPVRASRHPQSLSQELTLPRGEAAAPGGLSSPLQELSRGLAESLNRQGLGGRRVAVKIRYEDGEVATRSRTLSLPVASAAEIAEAAATLLDRSAGDDRPVRGLGISVSGLSRGAGDSRQLDLFSGTR